MNPKHNWENSIQAKLLRYVEVGLLLLLLIVTGIYTYYNKGLWGETQKSNNTASHQYALADSQFYEARRQSQIADSLTEKRFDSSAHQTDSALKIATAQLQITKNAFEVLNAPMVVLDSLYADTSSSLPASDLFSYRLQNFGKTPAIISNDEVAFSDSIDFIKDLGFKKITKVFAGAIGPSTLAPGQYFNVEHDDMRSYLREFRSSRPFTKFVTVIVHYQDVLRKNHIHLESYTHDPEHGFLTIKNLNLSDTTRQFKAIVPFPTH